MDEGKLAQLEAKIREMFAGESSGHDIHHLKRVLNLARHIQAKEGGDLEIISLAALAHDVHRLIQGQRGKYCSPAESLSTVRELLEPLSLPEETTTKILHCIEFHEEYSFGATGKTVSDLETLILQDADNLDAIGAIGIGRTFSFGGSHGLPMWDPEIPVERETFDDAVNDPTTLHHFYSKLLKLKDNMNTETGRQMAAARHAVMERFVEEFVAEWKGER